ncbi:acyclic terpene utilization AtuA family protein [Bosea sp. ASV33]|uniref:acyclic terpene utilization AtuA family protein n=1 Tax=Bosea sp. ASV33 TaxID=2795106 RepID=UPI0018ED1C22|nr:acyclic terpene utilization AtuA family protein [Bosea sp. ASV33]
MRTIRIGAGAGFAGDRIEPAVELACHGNLDYLVFECLAERTIALAQQARLADPDKGYDVLLELRMSAVLAACRENGTRIVTNMGAANPLAAAERVRDVARRLGLAGLKVAAVTGDDVLEAIRGSRLSLLEGGTLADLDNRIISANAYTGAAPIAEALAAGADVVVTGRAADPALFLGPLIHSFGWAADDWETLGKGVLAGHLLECAGQVTGGYFADPGVKDIEGLARLGFPIGEVSENGDLIVTKLEGTGGAVTTATVKEQLLYEIEDPARYLQPDVVADFSQVRVRSVGPDRVAVDGGNGAARTGLLKVSIGYIDGHVGEGQISYAGTGAVERGRLALAIVRERLALTGVPMTEVRFDLVGVDALHGAALSQGGAPYEVRVRVAARTEAAADAIAIGNEVEALYTNGPAGGGGVSKSVRQVVAIASALVPESLVSTQLGFFEA